MVKNVIRYYGGPTVPQDVKRRRQNSMETMRRLGTPFIIKHMFNDLDVHNGVAEKSPNFSDIYKQTRYEDPVSYGVGYVSVEKSTDEWVGPNGDLVVNTTESPGTGYVPAPKYRGYGPGYLTYGIFPDIAEDVFKINEIGVFIKTQQAQAQMPWYPEANDNDLLILCEIDRNENPITTHERFILKQTTPISMRGLDRRGRREYTEDFGNRHVINQQFEMTLLPSNNVLYGVEWDR